MLPVASGIRRGLERGDDQGSHCSFCLRYQGEGRPEAPVSWGKTLPWERLCSGTWTLSWLPLWLDQVTDQHPCAGTGAGAVWPPCGPQHTRL